MADSEIKLTGPTGIPYNELHTTVETGRDSKQEGPIVGIDKYEGGKIYVITMNRPHRMNALGGGLSQGLYDAWAEFRDDKNARVAIVTGRGSGLSVPALTLSRLRNAQSGSRRPTLS